MTVADNQHKQINIRVTLQAFEVLEAAVFVRKLRSPQDVLGPIAEQFLSSLAEEPDVKAAMGIREAHRPAASVSELPDRRRSRNPER